MASIDDFLDQFDAESAPRQVLRASLRRLRPTRSESFEISNVLLWLLVALLHVGLFLALDFAMRPSAIVDDAVDTPLQITIVQLAEAVKPRLIMPPEMHRPPHPQRAIPQTDTALQAVAIQPRAVTQPQPMSTDTRPALGLYDMQGRTRLPAPAIVTRRDPFARPAAANMLPGSDRESSPGIRLSEQGSPMKLVKGIIGGIFHPPPVETCSHYEERVLNSGNEAERDENMDRYERECM